MALVKYGEMISAMSGRINGTIHLKGRFGAVMRNGTIPVNPQTTFQSAVRNNFAFFSQNWRALTEVQRDAWTGAIDNFTFNNVFGDTVRPTGENLYISLNRNIFTAGGVAITSPPVPGTVASINSLSVVADVSLATIIATYAPAIPATGTVLIFATAPLSAGINFVKNKYRFIEAIVTADASPYNITASYEAKFGTGWLTAGQKLFVRFVPMITLSGIKGVGLETSTIVIP